MEDKILHIAQQYARKRGDESVRPAGEQNGCRYFHIFTASNKGHKTGLPHIIKINEAGQVALVANLTERMWAVKQEVSLMSNL